MEKKVKNTTINELIGTCLEMLMLVIKTLIFFKLTRSTSDIELFHNLTQT